MTEVEINSFEKIVGQLTSLREEISIIAKKTPNDSVNKFKLKLINELLQKANKILGKKYQAFEDFECFEDESLPTASDVVFICGQYLECCEKLRADNIMNLIGPRWTWIINGENSGLRTSPPKKIENR